VRVEDLRCMNLPDNTNNFQWLASNWQGSILVNDLIYDSTPTVGSYYSVTGLVNYNFSEWKLEPRMESDIEVSTSTGLSEVSNGTLRTYPNPATTALFVDLSALEGRSEVELVDATGRVALTTSSGSSLLQVDVNTVATGMYTLTVRNNGQVISRRVSVQH